MKKAADTTTFQTLEQDAYHAFLEWPLFLIRRIRQLEAHLAATEANITQQARDVQRNPEISAGKSALD